MAKLINKEYLEFLLADSVKEEIKDIALELENRAKEGYRHVSICRGKHRVFDENRTATIGFKETGYSSSGRRRLPIFLSLCRRHHIEALSTGCCLLLLKQKNKRFSSFIQCVLRLQLSIALSISGSAYLSNTIITIIMANKTSAAITLKI